MSDLYRDFIDRKADQIITDLGGTITPTPPNELYRDFPDRKFDDVINAIGNLPNIKTFTYTGTGTAAHDIVFSQTPVFVLGIFGNVSGYKGVILPFYNGITYAGVNLYAALTNAPLSRTLNVTYPADKTINIEGSSENFSLNTNGNTYTVYYI